jgi:uncharacterized protein YjdB
VKNIYVSKKSFNIVKNNEVSLSTTFAPTYATEQRVTWKSSDDKIATVSTSGVVKGIAAGEAEITATSVDGGKSVISKVKVWADGIPVESIVLDADKATLFPGSTKQLSASILPVDASNQKITWATSDPSVVTVSEAGLVTVVKEGSAIITATTESEKKVATFTVTAVAPLAFENFNYPFIKTSADKNRLQQRGSATDGWGEPWVAHWVMGMDGITEDGQWKINGGADVFLQRKFVTTFPNVKDAVYWLSFKYRNTTKSTTASSNEAQWGTAYFDLGGGTKMFVGSTKSSGRKVGMMDEWGSKVNSTYEDTLENVVVVKIIMSGSGANNKAILFVNPQGDAEPQEADAVGSMGWWSMGKGIDQIFIGARNPFSAIFDNIRFATTYKAFKPVSSISISETDIVIDEIGLTKQLTAKVLPADASNPGFSWMSSDTTIISVNAEGLVTAIGKGNAVVTAVALDGKKSSCNITVNSKVGVGETGLSQIKVYPNPVKNNLHISTLGQNNNLTILNLNGQVVKSVVNNNGTINVSDLVNGVYFIKIESSSLITTRRIIIAK